MQKDNDAPEITVKELVKDMPRPVAYGFLGAVAALVAIAIPATPLILAPVIAGSLAAIVYTSSVIGLTLGMALTGDFKEIPKAPGYIARTFGALFGAAALTVKNDIGNLWKKIVGPAKTAPPKGELFVVSDDGQDLVPESQIKRQGLEIPPGPKNELFVLSADGSELVLASQEAFKREKAAAVVTAPALKQKTITI